MQNFAVQPPPFQGFFGDEEALPEEAAATYVAFEIGGQLLAADVIHVREILDMMPISPLPNTAAEILGMVDVRGEGVAVIDLQHRLQLPAKPASQRQKIIILELCCAGESAGRPIGIIADLVRSVVEITPSQIEAIPATFGGWRNDLMTGVARWEGALVYMLSLQHLLSSQGAGDASASQSMENLPCL